MHGGQQVVKLETKTLKAKTLLNTSKQLQQQVFFIIIKRFKWIKADSCKYNQQCYLVYPNPSILFDGQHGLLQEVEKNGSTCRVRGRIRKTKMLTSRVPIVVVSCCCTHVWGVWIWSPPTISSQRKIMCRKKIVKNVLYVQQCSVLDCYNFYINTTEYYINHSYKHFMHHNVSYKVE